MAGVSISAGFMKLLPKWLIVFDVLPSAAKQVGSASYSETPFPHSVDPIPSLHLLIAAGFLLPKAVKQETPMGA